MTFSRNSKKGGGGGGFHSKIDWKLMVSTSKKMLSSKWEEGCKKMYSGNAQLMIIRDGERKTVITHT